MCPAPEGEIARGLFARERRNRGHRPAGAGPSAELIPILMYHAVGVPRDRRFARWVVSPDALETQLRSLIQAGYTLVGLTDWALQRTNEKTAVLTFDDGYHDFVDQALPVLKRLAARATVYVATGYIGGTARWLPLAAERDRPMMTWEDLNTLDAEGIEVGSHGHMHLELDTRSSDIARRDIVLSRDELVRHGFRPTSFAYPYGYVDDSVRGMVAAAGFRTACTVGDGLFRADRDRLRMRRLIIDSRSSSDALMNRVSGPEVTLQRRVLEAGRVPWREVRRARHRIGARE
jgi:peptidoglycan/xylan/chitin deacetylase (PgdA/CDA1 family)